MTYAVVTPAHNEAANLERLLASLAAQTLPPERWVIVENGSTDGTLDVASELREAHDWIDVRSLLSQGPADRGAPIVRAIHEGLDTLERAGVAFDVVVVVDGDVTFPTGYFETLVSRFDADGRLGMASGTCFEQEHGVWQERHVTGDHVWGASRAYRREVLPIVMPLEPRMGWDGIDQIKANVAGWGTATFKDLPFYHHRPEGSRDGTGLKARINQGRASHYMGYRLSYLCLRTLFALRNDLAAPGLLVGYSLEAAARRERCPDAGVRQYVRTQQSATVWRRRLNEARGRR